LSPSPPRPGVEYLPVCSDEMRLAVAADHPLATRASIGLEELQGEDFLITRSPVPARTPTSSCTHSATPATSPT
jgi:DNA-binding transcriptional LysR family regulator